MAEKTPEQLKTQVEQVREALRAKAPGDFNCFIHSLLIPSSRGPISLAANIAPFQEETFQAIGPALQSVANGTMPKRRKFWIERTKKASKDGDLALMLLWLLAFAKRPLLIQVGAADREQAAIVKKRMQDTVYYNPWLAKLVDIQRFTVRSINGLAELDILAADASSAHGGTPDLMVVNELSHVSKWGFVETLLDNAAGVPYGVVIIATNAGFSGSNSEQWRKNAIESPDWETLILQEPSPWINPSDLRDAQQRNSPSRFARLWQGEWVSIAGDSFDVGDVSAAFKNTHSEMQKPESGWNYIAGLDLGISNDHSGYAMLAYNSDIQRIKLVNARRWKPQVTTGEVDLMAVERHVKNEARTFNAQATYYDPYQAKLLAQRLSRTGIRMKEMRFSGHNLDRMATSYKAAIEARILDLYDDAQLMLQDDLNRLQIVERPYGYRLEATRDASGHADLATALVIALAECVDRLGPSLFDLDENTELIMDAGDALSPEEEKDLPDILSDIYRDA